VSTVYILTGLNFEH